MLFVCSLGNFTTVKDYTTNLKSRSCLVNHSFECRREITGAQPNYSAIILIVRRFTVVSRRSVVVGLRVWHVWRGVLPILRRGAGRRHAIPVPLVAIHCKQQLHWTTISEPPNTNSICQTNIPVISLSTRKFIRISKTRADFCSQQHSIRKYSILQSNQCLDPIKRSVVVDMLRDKKKCEIINDSIKILQRSNGRKSANNKQTNSNANSNKTRSLEV